MNPLKLIVTAFICFSSASVLGDWDSQDYIYTEDGDSIGEVYCYRSSFMSGAVSTDQCRIEGYGFKANFTADGFSIMQAKYSLSPDESKKGIKPTNFRVEKGKCLILDYNKMPIWAINLTKPPKQYFYQKERSDLPDGRCLNDQ